MATYTHFSGNIGDGNWLPAILTIPTDEFVIVPGGQTSSTQYVWNVISDTDGSALYTVVYYGSFVLDAGGQNHGVSTLVTGVERFDPLGNPIDSITGDAVAPGVGFLSGNDTMYGFAGADVLIGSSGNDIEYGYGGNDQLDAGPGFDTLYGGDGNDGLQAGPLDGGTEVALMYGGAGDDFLEGWKGNDSLYGGSGNDILNGGDGNNILNGGTGADTMTGGEGNDTYYVDNAKDQVIEDDGTDPLGGFDTVMTTVNFLAYANGAGGGWGTAIEKISAHSAKTGIVLGGDQFTKTMIGSDFNDTLIGGLGKQTLTGGLGADTFVLQPSTLDRDTITDFTRGQDHLSMAESLFGPLNGTHVPFAGRFLDNADGLASNGGNAQTRVIYDHVTGGVYFDRDGTGTLYSSILIATLTGHPVLDATDFWIV